MRAPVVLISCALAAVCAVAAPVGSSGSPAMGTGSGYAINAWGSDSDAMLGHSGAVWRVADAPRPQQVELPASVRITQLSVSPSDALALTSAGAVYAWGFNGLGQLGIGTAGSHVSPPQLVQFPAGIVVTSVSAGNNDSLAVTSTGAVYGWGDNAGGLAGQNPDIDVVTTPTLISSAPPALAVAAGNNTGFILSTAGHVYALGTNSEGSMGTGAQPTATAIPTEVTFPGDPTIVSIAAGYNNGYALTSSGAAFAWGSDASGLLGDGGQLGSESDTPVAMDLPSQTVITSISADQLGDHALALTTSGAVYAWGSDAFGQLGDGAGAITSTPVSVEVPAGVAFSMVSSGENTSLALTSTGRVYAWGLGGDGQLGNGSTTNEPTPVAVEMPQGARAYGVGMADGTSVALVTPEPPPTIKPTINGVPRVGDTLACAASAPIPISSSPTWRWTSGHTKLSTAQTYAVRRADVGSLLRCTMTLDDGYGTSTATSASDQAIWHTSLVNLKRPMLTGPHKPGSTEQVSHGRWTPHPTKWHYQWYVGGTPLTGATHQRLNVPKGARDTSIRCNVTVRRKGDNSASTFTRSVKVR